MSKCAIPTGYHRLRGGGTHLVGKTWKVLQRLVEQVEWSKGPVSMVVIRIVHNLGLQKKNSVK